MAGCGDGLKTENLSVTIGGHHILHGISIHARPGEVLGLIGPNGAGKSTLLSAISGDMPAKHITSGQVSIGGLTTTDLSQAQLARLRSVMLQDVSVSFSFLVRDVVAMGRRPWVRTAKAEFDDAIVDAALRATGTDHLADRDIMTLSGGERARVALSRVLAQQTPVVLLDEPTAALDIAHQEQALGLIRAMAAAGAAVILVVHDLNAAAAYCDRIACLEKGRLAAAGTIAEVYTEEKLSDIYGWPISVHRPHGDDGILQVLPHRGHDIAAVESTRELLYHLNNSPYVDPIDPRGKSGAPPR
ncbi:heme ABC transporter ATP-binding protein [Corynebacterium mendelii]|uniref:Heme ABC transporter ATP-binding protein n=1 Tax=Corynebacterium mendelii TaxID=2765362 RepID=A0A939E1Q4_9CORY|nr:heme ABC transporter ATP-binding protein [Corynebacterium mendelii]MBN9644086.1 heme ABC transporter ATP-binding protein [Corynebacterium mendelii]